MFKKLFISLGALSVSTLSVFAIVSCSKQANAALPIEYVITSENLKFRTDRTDARALTESWEAEKPAELNVQQKAFSATVAQSIVGVLKSVITGYSSDFSQVDDNNWKSLFQDINAQRSGSNSLMIEMSRMHFENLGQLSVSSIAPNSGATITIKLTKIEFDCYKTDGNSPNEAFKGLLPKSAGHHYEIDLTANPILAIIGFTNQTTTPITTIDKVPFDTPTSYVVCSSENIINETVFKDILNSTPKAENYYKSKITKEEFKKIFGTNTSPQKITT